MDWLYSTCRLSDGIHWMRVRADGYIADVSSAAFVSEEQALSDVGIHQHI